MSRQLGKGCEQMKKIFGCLGGLLCILAALGIIAGFVLLFTGYVDTSTSVIIEVASVLIVLVIWGLSRLIFSKSSAEDMALRKKMGEEAMARQSSDSGKKSLCMILYLYGVFNIIIGLVPLLFNVEILRDLGLGIIQIIAGVIFVILGYFVGKKSLIALITAIIIVLGDLASIVYSFIANGFPSSVIAGITFGVIIHIYILSALIPGIRAIIHLKKSDKISPSDTIS
jgi:hypothetical protein